MITIETNRIPSRDKLLKLYGDAGWTPAEELGCTALLK